MDHDQRPWYQHPTSSTILCAHSQEALGFVAAPSVLVITPLPDVINKKFPMAQIYWARVTIYKETLPVRIIASRESNRSWSKPKLDDEGSTMGDCYFSPKHSSMAIAKIIKSTISVWLDIEGKTIRRSNWYAFERYEETKGIKFKKTIGLSFPRLDWENNNVILMERKRKIEPSACTNWTRVWFRMKIWP
jgi:hypothetical protein